jgi:hypothetical protein
MNPFFLKFASDSLRDTNGIIAPEPYNLCVGRFERNGEISPSALSAAIALSTQHFLTSKF